MGAHPNHTHTHIHARNARTNSLTCQVANGRVRPRSGGPLTSRPGSSSSPPLPSAAVASAGFKLAIAPASRRRRRGLAQAAGIGAGSGDRHRRRGPARGNNPSGSGARKRSCLQPGCTRGWICWPASHVQGTKGKVDYNVFSRFFKPRPERGLARRPLFPPLPLLRDLLDAPTVLAACCGFDLCRKYILYLYLYSAGSLWVTYFHGIRARPHSEHAPGAHSACGVRHAQAPVMSTISRLRRHIKFFTFFCDMRNFSR